MKSSFVAKAAALALMLPALIALPGCGQHAAAPLGSPSNPITMALVPSLETGQITVSADALAKALEQKTGYTIDVKVPVSYAAVIEAMGAGRVDIGWYGPLSYVLAHKTAGAQALLITVREGQTHYYGEILVRKNSPIRRIEDLKGKKFAFVDPLSTSGTLYPQALLRQHGIDPQKDLQAIYAGGHDKAIIALANKQVDACSCYAGTDSDARDRVKSVIPNIKDITRVIARTAPIPNDNVSVRKDLPPQVREKIRTALLEIAHSPDGQKMLRDVGDIDSLEPVKDSTYDTVRTMAKGLGLNLEEAVKKEGPVKKPQPKKP